MAAQHDVQSDEHEVDIRHRKPKLAPQADTLPEQRVHKIDETAIFAVQRVLRRSEHHIAVSVTHHCGPARRS